VISIHPQFQIASCTAATLALNSEISNFKLFFLLAPLALLVFYFAARLRIGRRPSTGSVVPRYEPPTGLSAAAARYILISNADGRSVAAVLAQLATLGLISVEPQSSRYRISRRAANPAVEINLAGEEARILEMLFEDTNPVTLNPSDTDDLKRYTLAIQGALLKRLANRYVKWHVGSIAAGVAVSILLAILVVFSTSSAHRHSLLLFAWMIYWTAILFSIVLLVLVRPVVKNMFHGILEWRRICLTLFLLAFLALALQGFTQKQFTREFPPPLILSLAALGCINVFAAPLFKTFTRDGRQALAEIAGFKKFLAKVEQDQYDRLNKPHDTPQPTGQFLPYAIALEIKAAWGDHLADLFL
jgi:hypothetical protein